MGVRRAELRSRWSYVGTKLAYVGLSLDLHWLKLATFGRKVAYVGPSRASEDSRELMPSRIWPKMGPRWVKMKPRGQDEAKMGPMLAVMLLRLCETLFLKNERFA